MSQRDREKRRPVSAARRVAEHSSGDRPSLKMPEGLSFWRPKKPDSYRIEIIPYTVGEASTRMSKTYAKPGEDYWERTFFTHAGIGPNNESYVCLAKTFGKPCPVCEQRDAYLKSPNKEAEEAAKALRPKERQLFLIVDHAEPHKGVQLWEVSNWCFGKQLDAKLNGADPEDRDRYMQFADPYEGSTLKLLATEETMGGGSGKFLKFSVDEFRARREPLDEEWINHGYALDAMIQPVPYAELKRIFLQTGGDEDDAVEKAPARSSQRDEDDDAPPKKTPPAARASRPPADEDDAPPPRKTAKAPADEDDDAPGKTSGDWRPGDAVAYAYRDKQYTGKIVKIDAAKEIAHVQPEGIDRQHVVDLEDLTVAPRAAKGKPPADEDDAPPPRKTAAKAPADDEDDDAPARKPRAAKSSADDEDDAPPRKKKVAEPDDSAEDAPPPPRKKAINWDDEDDDPPSKKAPADDEDDDAPPPRKKK